MKNIGPVYIDPLSDFGFKRLFTSGDKTLLIAFLNDIIGAGQTIEDIVSNQNEWVGTTEDEKSILLDLVCTDKKGKQFIVEVQRKKQNYFKSRALYYASKLISMQLAHGIDKYPLLPVYFIAIMEFKLEEMDDEWIDDVYLCSLRNGKIFDKTLRFTYFALTNFRKPADQLVSNLERWIYLFKNLPYVQAQPETIRGAVFDKLFKLAAFSKLSAEDQAMYKMEYDKEWMNKVYIESVKDDGEKEGFEKGHNQAVQKISDAFRLRKTGATISHISSITELSVQELEELFKSAE